MTNRDSNLKNPFDRYNSMQQTTNQYSIVYLKDCYEKYSICNQSRLQHKRTHGMNCALALELHNSKSMEFRMRLSFCIFPCSSALDLLCNVVFHPIHV